jgi:hypothetical protein
MSSPEAALGLCMGWLRGEETYQFQKYGPPNPSNFHERIRVITRQEVPNRWHQYRLFRAQDAPDRATQAVMKTLATARAGAIIGNMVRGGDYGLSSTLTIRDLREATPVISTHHDALKSRLSLPLEVAMGRVSYGEDTLYEGYVTLAGLAITHVMDDAERRGQLWLPEPGHPSGEIVEWTATGR